MKVLKWILITLLALFFVGLVIGDDEQQAEPVEKPKVEKKVEKPKKEKPAKKVNAEKKKTEENRKKEQEEEKRKAEEQAEEEKILAEIDYREEVAEISTNLANHMSDFSQLNADAGVNPLMIYNQDWIFEVALVLVKMEEEITKMESIQAPIHLQPAHDEILSAMAEFRKSSDKYILGIDNDDMTLLDEAINHIDKGTDHINRAGDLLNGE